MAPGHSLCLKRALITRPQQKLLESIKIWLEWDIVFIAYLEKKKKAFLQFPEFKKQKVWFEIKCQHFSLKT